MNKQNIVTRLVFLIDRSGSMSHLQQSVIEGFNGFIANQRKQDDLCTVSLYQFDDQYQADYVDKPLAEVPALNTSTYQPRGGTALYDALVRAINDLSGRTSLMDQVLFVIQTDGYENASKEANAATVKSLVQSKTELGWNFTYLGANLDAIAEASHLGIASGCALQFNANANSNKATYGLMTNKVSTYRATKATGAEGTQVMSYTADEARSVDV